MTGPKAMLRKLRGPHVSASDARIFTLSAIVISIGVWDVAFHFGVFGTVFYSRLFAVWVAATAFFLASLFVPRDHRHAVHTNWIGRLVLILPTAWMVAALVSQRHGIAEPRFDLVWFLGLAVALVSLPYTLYVLVLAVSPELQNLHNPRLFVLLVLIVGAIGTAGYLMGTHNELFVSCWEFEVSGNDLPPRCG